MTVTIEKTRSGVTYADTGEVTATAAQDLAERGVFIGAKIGDKWYFEPDRTVSRGEFLAMVLETAGAEVTDVTMTGFRDDDAIPTWAKSYAAAGVAEGILRGKPTEDGAVFSCEEPISFSEAATVLNRVLDLGDVELEVWFADREAAPSWAAQAVGNMEALNVLSVGSFGSDRLETAVTRADAARMLSAAGTLLRGEKDTGLLGLLKKVLTPQGRTHPQNDASSLPVRAGCLPSEQNRGKSSYCIQRGFVLNYYNYNRLK